VSDHVNIVGNVYDKFGTTNPLARRLMSGFLEAITGIYEEVAPGSVLEVGCGEGRLSDHLVGIGSAPERFVGLDLSLACLAEDLDPRIEFREGSAYDLEFDDDSFDLVVLSEVLEHLERPSDALAEAARVASRAVIVSVPWEPVWRLLNLARLKYVRSLGNTPGHIQHFSRRGLLRLLRTRLRVTDVRRPLPWTIALGEPRTEDALA